MLDLYYANVHEDNIRDAICDFLVETGLASHDDLWREENRIDIQSENLVIEVKRRIGSTGRLEPDPANVGQLDGYLREAREAGKPERLGILTDGMFWVLRVPGDATVRTGHPYAFTLSKAEAWFRLFEWLRDESQAIEQTNRPPDEDDIRQSFSAGPRFDNSIARLTALYEAHRHEPSVAVKRDLWRPLLTAALGIVVEEEPDLDRLFVRHTYLSMVVGMAVQSAFGIDIRRQADHDPATLLNGAAFLDEVGMRGVVESDFFAWPAETGDDGWIGSLAERVARFEWGEAGYDVVRILYQSVIPAEDRRRLGEYYTPDWLADAIVKEVVTDPLRQRVLDPACGSGTFLRAAVRAFIEAARAEGLDAGQTVDRLRTAVTGIDIHPVSVHLARATWVLAARETITEAGASATDLTVPVYLGDSLQLRTAPTNMFNHDTVTVTVEPSEETGDQARRLTFPRALVEQGDWFDSVMMGIGEAIGMGRDPRTALDDNDIPDGPERTMLEETLGEMQALHAEGRDHIWAYYTRNLVRPVWLASRNGQVDAIVGNPPWITYNRTEATLRSELRKLSQSGEYGIWAGRQYATHQDVAGLFYARCADLYLKEGGEMAMVLPHSALQAGQYRLWRGGRWGLTEVDLSERQPWDLERIEPNDFFPVPSCVAFARKRDTGDARPLARRARRWRGPVGGPFRYETIPLAGAGGFASPYAERARQGASMVPRLFYFVTISPSPVAILPGIVRASLLGSPQEKPPWKHLDPPELRDAPIEDAHVWPVHRGDTVAPFAILDPKQAVLPLRKGAEPPGQLRSDASTALYGIESALMERRMRNRWEIIGRLWDENKNANNNLDLLGRLDYMHNFSTQVERETSPRLLYSSSGRPTAVVLDDVEPLVDYTLFRLSCRTREEGDYLAAIINSNALRDAVEPLMPKGQFGARHVQRHLWRLAIPEYDAGTPLHRELAEAGAEAAREASARLAALRESREGAVDDKLARRELRGWLESSELGARIESLAARLLAAG